MIRAANKITGAKQISNTVAQMKSAARFQIRDFGGLADELRCIWLIIVLNRPSVHDIY